MLELGGETDLAQEALATQGKGQIGMEHLDGDLPIVLEVAREKHRRHAAPTQLALHVVPIGERRETEQGVCQRALT